MKIRKVDLTHLSFFSSAWQMDKNVSFKYYLCYPSFSLLRYNPCKSTSRQFYPFLFKAILPPPPPWQSLFFLSRKSPYFSLLFPPWYSNNNVASSALYVQAQPASFFLFDNFLSILLDTVILLDYFDPTRHCAPTGLFWSY